MSKKNAWIQLTRALMLVTVVLTGATAAAQLVLYDDFSAKRLDPGKWIGVPSSVSGDGDVDRREVSVGLAGLGASRGLHISQTMYSTTAINTGSGGSGFGLGFANASKLTAVSFSMTINDGQSLGCGANAAFVVAGFSADFFNPNPSPDGATGDITVSIAASRASTDTEPMSKWAAGSPSASTESAITKPACLSRTSARWHLAAPTLWLSPGTSRITSSFSS
jgi:hypothetical protein